MSRLLISTCHIALTLFIVMATTSINAQSAGQYIAKGDKEQKDGYYQSAVFYYKKALGIDTNLLEANYQTAEAYRKLRNYKRAANFYEATIAVDGQDQYPEAHFFLALMLKQQGKYEEAERRLRVFQSIYNSRDQFYKWARDEVASVQWAIDHQNDTANYTVSDPDSGLNTIHAELSPYFLDTNTLYFSTMRYEKDEVKKSNPVFVEMKKAFKDSNRWVMAELELPIEEKDEHVGNGTFSEDGNRFYYSRCASLSECKIYFTQKNDSVWSEPTALAEPVNESNSTSTQPALLTLEEEEYLIFSSNRERGKGGMDLWFVKMRDGQPTARLRNMGSNINSDGDEITPFYDREDTTLYFSSNRLNGFGGFDVFQYKGMPGNTNIPENLGPEINTPADDYYFMGRTSDTLAIFASNRISGKKKSGNETCCNDLYLARPVIIPEEVIDTVVPPVDTIDSLDAIPAIAAVPQDSVQPEPVKEEVVEEIEQPKTLEELQTLLPISLYFHNDRPNPRTLSKTTTRTYPETIDEYLGLKTEYVDALNASDLNADRKLEIGDQMQVFFKDELERSLVQMDKALKVLLTELNDSVDINLAVRGYASTLASSEYNLNLTYRRIMSMENYIRSFQNGAFLPFLENGQLNIERIPYGESKASQSVSDSDRDALGSIYSPEAAKERRIEILRIERSN